MGVPSFYSWLQKRYPMSVYPFTKHHGHHVDFLYLDMNLVIYKCATSPNILFRDQLRNRNFDEVWTLILNYLNTVIDLTNPQLGIFMAFDGVAPRAKMNQQRQRRFSSSKHDQKIQQQLKDLGMEQSNSTFKNNQISPGTEFMYELNQQLRFYIQRKFYEDEKFAHLKVMFSGSDVPGEGEHKMLKFIRNLRNTPDYNPDWTHVIYSVDADLIMLGLSTHIKNMGILRETQSFDRNKSQIAAQRLTEKPTFDIINLQIVKEYFHLEYSEIQEIMKIPYNIDRIIDDFVLVFFFVGNDFLPRIFCFDIRQGTVELLIQMFKQFLRYTNQYVTDKGKINWPQMVELLLLFSKFEVQAMEDRVTELKKIIKGDEVENRQQLQQELNTMEQLKEKYQKKEDAQARKQFYKDKCQLDMDSEDGLKHIANMAQKYLEGIQFVLDYYYVGVPSWEWYYPFYYSPLCSDIHLYLESNLKEWKIEFNPSEPFHPFMQLMLIITPHNKSLLPEQLRHLLEVQSPLRQPFDYYPLEFEIDPFGAIWEHQYITKIPFMDLKLLQEQYNSIDQTQLDPIDFRRNQLGRTTLFQLGNGQSTLVQSKIQGVIQDFQSKHIEQDFNNNSQEELNQLVATLVKRNQFTRPAFPSLNTQNILNHWVKTTRKKDRKIVELQIQIKSKELTFIDEIEKAKKKGKSYHGYCGYPQSYYGEVAAIITEKSFILMKQYQMNDFNSFSGMEDRGQDYIFAELVNQVQQDMDSMGIDMRDIKAVAIVFFYRDILRKSDGTFYYNKMTVREELMPIEFISKDKILDLNDYKIQERPLEVEFPIGQKVIQFLPDKKLNGSIAEVVRVDKQYNKVLMALKQVPTQVKTVVLTAGADLAFYTVKFVSEKLQVRVETVLFIMGTVKIAISKKDRIGTSEMLAEQIDIGLNTINKHKNMLVPELVRLNNANSEAEGYKKYEQFKGVEISKILLDHLIEYQKLMPELFNFLDNLSNDKQISLRDIYSDRLFPKDPDCYQKLLKVYVWVLTLPTSQYMLCNVASKTVPSDYIQKYQQQKFEPEVNVETNISSQPGWFLRQEKLCVSPYLSEHPAIHSIADRVVAINDNFTAFGSYGTVIGIIDQGEIMIEVIWDEPRFGLSNLGGRCGLLRGSLVRFMDVFNLTANWTKQLKSQLASNVDKGWSYSQKLFKPKFGKGIDNEHVEDKVLGLQQQKQSKQKQYE